MRPALRVAAFASLLIFLAGCSTPPAKPARSYRTPPRVVKTEAPATATTPAPAEERDGPPATEEIPPDLELLPDMVPEYEPSSRYGNPKTYEVFGKTYTIMPSAEGYRETGLASWYGKKFHGRRTSSGEPYDMFKLTAAHKTLPIPCYARVTNLKNGKSVIVRINDRGPFHAGRIIDLSYAAATKIGSAGGVAMVEVEAITPGKKLPPPPAPETITPPPPGNFGFLQVAAFSDPINAVSLREELIAKGLGPIEIRIATLDGLAVHRVLIGPFTTRAELEASRKKLASAAELEAQTVGQ